MHAFTVLAAPATRSIRQLRRYPELPRPLPAPSPLLEKPALRRLMRARRRTLAIDRAAAARAAAGFLPDWRGLVVGGYNALGGEFDPAPVLAALGAAGARIALPACVAAGAPLIFRAATGVLAPDALGVPAPPRGAPVLDPDVVLTPLLAFDLGGGRLGQGGGHFDRTIAAVRAHRPVLVVGLGFSAQEVRRVPMDAHDQRLDAILTEKGYREAQKDV